MTTSWPAAKSPSWSIVEAVARLLPGVLGNAESAAAGLVSADGLLEAPAYTRPASWRGLEVPPVLLSGDHAADRALARRAEPRRTERGPTARPDLL